MKRLFFIICVSIICTFVNAQEPEIKIRDQIVLGSRVMSVDPSCSPDISAYDKQSQSFVEIRPCMNLNILKYKTEDQCEMYVLSLLTLSQHSLSIPSGSRLLLKSIDGKTLELKTTEETKS